MRRALTTVLLCLICLTMSAQEQIATRDYSSVNSKKNDLGLAFNLDVEKKLARRLSLDVEGEFRTQDNTSKAERWMVGAALQYKFFQTPDKKFNLKAGLGFNYLWKYNLSETTLFDRVTEHYNSAGIMNGYTEKSGYKTTENFWRKRWRTSLAFTATYSPSKRWSFSLKETFQYNRYCSTDSIGRIKTTQNHYKWRQYGTDPDAGNLTDYDYRWATQDDGTTMYYYDSNRYGVNDEDNLYEKSTPDQETPYSEVDNKSPRKAKDKWVLRSKLSMKYNIKGLPLNPYASIDYGVGLNYHANKWKYTVGTEYKINKQNKIDFYYRFAHDNDDDEPNGHLIGIGYKHSF